MAPKNARRTAAASQPASGTSRKPPTPFKAAPESLQAFYGRLSPRHVYVTHVDSKPAAFKRKIFSVPVLMNVGVALLFAWRLWYIGPYYAQLVQTALGTPNSTTLVAKDLTWPQLAAAVLRRAFTFMLDLVLAVFVWPWPVEFCFGSKHGNPVGWRLQVGFRDKEVYVRRSRSWYVAPGGDGAGSAEKPAGAAAPVDLDNDDGRRLLLAHIRQASSPLLTQQKTGYLTMDGNWDLDWDLMVWATHLVDTKEMTLGTFAALALVHHADYGWLTVDPAAIGAAGGSSGSAGGGDGGGGADDERRRQVFAFRDALAALGKEDLFFRWIEIIQFEVTRPGGLGDEQRQAAVAKQVRDEFQAQGVDFDRLWAETVGTDGLHGM